MINPTKSKYWKVLKTDYTRLKKSSISSFFKLNSRFSNFSINYKNTLLFDFSKNIIDELCLKNLIYFAEDMNLKEEINNMFLGKKINKTENRSVLHTALRDFSKKPLIVDNIDIKIPINKTLEKIKSFEKKFSQKKYKYIVNIGIGGSDLGIRMTCNALKDFSKKKLKIYFVSNVDTKEIKDILEKIDLEKTLFVICSKTFTTQETMFNANFAKNYFLNKLNKSDISENFIAVSTNINKVLDFGISNENIFEFWDWVGGRYSIWSSIGVSLCLYIGYENFISFLEGGNEIDLHFRQESFDKNIPVVMALISIFYTNFFKSTTSAVICYSHRMKYFVPYLQQCVMESNGKSVDKNNKFVNYQTGNIIWGGVGTDAQHSFFQLLHQGTKIIPSDFITFVDSFDENKLLLSNFIAQTNSLAFGKKKGDVINEMKANLFSNEDIQKLVNHKTFKGNKPSNSLIFKSLNPYTLGMITAIYEHKTFVEGVLWNIFSFDQWGVELGKSMCNDILDKFDKKKAIHFDSSTDGIINFILEK